MTGWEGSRFERAVVGKESGSGGIDGLADTDAVHAGIKEVATMPGAIHPCFDHGFG